MSAIKRFSEEVSALVGDGGELTQRSQGIACIAMLLCADKKIKRNNLTDKNPEFIKIVKNSEKLWNNHKFFVAEETISQHLEKVAYDALMRIPDNTEVEELKILALKIRYPFIDENK